MSGELKTGWLQTVMMVVSYLWCGGFILIFTLAGRRPWTGIAVFVVLTWAFQVHVSHRPWRELGLWLRWEALSHWICGAIAGGIVFGFVALVMIATGALTLAKGGAYGPVRGIAIVLAVTALIEEMLFRGYPLQTLSRAWGDRPALIATSAAFAAAHMLNPGAGLLAAVGVFIGGCAFGAACLRWRSLWVSWGAHFAWNASQILWFGFPVNGTPFAALGGAAHYVAQLHGSAWLTGGAFGPEASLPSMAIIGAAAWLLLRPVSPSSPSPFSHKGRRGA